MGETGLFVIRHAAVADAPAMAEVIAASFAEYAGRLLPESGALAESVQTITARLLDERAGLAETKKGARPVGCVLFRIVGQDEIYLGRLAVLPEWRGRGIARALIGFVESEARRLGAKVLSLGVRVALPQNQILFAACGFREVSRSAHPGFSLPTSIRMEKRLDGSS